MPSITQVTRKYLEVNELGRRINSSHPNCSVSQEIVDSIRLLRETLGLSYSALSIIFSLPRETCGKYCRYEIRSQTGDRWKTVYETKTFKRET